MFRNPRENAERVSETYVPPSIGRPPTPPTFPPPRSNPHVPPPMAVKTSSTTRLKAAKITPVKPKPAANGNILAFFKKAEELNDQLFVKDRFNELGGSDKRRRVSGSADSVDEVGQHVEGEACTPPPPENRAATVSVSQDDDRVDTPIAADSKPRRRKQTGPFMSESDSEDEDEIQEHAKADVEKTEQDKLLQDLSVGLKSSTNESHLDTTPLRVDNVMTENATEAIPLLKREETSFVELGDIEEFEGIQDFDDEFADDGEEFIERKYMQEQFRLQMSDGTYEGELEDDDLMLALSQSKTGATIEDDPPEAETATCPICSVELKNVTDEQASVHVNNCLDGNPTPLPTTEIKSEASTPKLAPKRPPIKMRPPRPGQINPIVLGATASKSSSAFEKLMSGHAEDTAWKTAAVAEKESRGKQAFERTCPFYKIMPDMSICVDAFRYGAVEGCKAYFLSHFHSDHYIGLTSSWRHGPIYCSRVTGNLVRQQLRVDPKYVKDLEFEEETEIPGTGTNVIMISANHCPGSSLFLFEKPVSKTIPPKKKRILHCGDFRACRAHVEHPLLRPDVQCHITGKQKEQNIDICYLDTTYLNPKFAFPSQETVIKSCADMCVSLNKASVDDSDDWESMKRDRAGAGMVQFLQSGAQNIKQEDLEPSDGKKKRGRLLVVVGTYSIGKERICLGIAKALGSKIFATPGKQRICAALEDPEIMSRLTSNPREAQVHMTPLFEIRADTLDEYLRDYRDVFTRAVAFRPSGWNYRPPNSRFTESPSVQTVLHSNNWKSVYTMKELKPQPGSTKRATCYGVPYSEHSSFRELTMFCCALRIDKIIPTVNVGSAKSRERMKLWIDRWAQDKKKNGLFKAEEFAT